MSLSLGGVEVCFFYETSTHNIRDILLTAGQGHRMDVHVDRNVTVSWQICDPI